MCMYIQCVCVYVCERERLLLLIAGACLAPEVLAKQ